MNAAFEVLVGVDTGWFSDTRFQMDVVPDSHGFLRITRMAEVEALEPGRSTGPLVEEQSWSSIKGLYR